MGLSRECISLPSLSSSWTKHSNLIQPRIYASTITMTSGDVYLLGGWYSDLTSEVLLQGASTWSQGPDLPDPLDSVCALSLDDTTFVTIGGGRGHTTVSKYDTATKMWDHTWPNLAEGRRGHSCARLGSILVVAGGFSFTTFQYTDSTLTINSVTGISIFKLYTMYSENKSKNTLFWLNGVIQCTILDKDIFEFVLLMLACVKPNSHVKSLNFLEAFQCESFGISSSAAKMNFPRAYFSLLTMGDAFVAIGGVTNEGYTTEMEVFFNFTKAWSRQDSDLNLDTARSSFAAILLPSSTTTTLSTLTRTTTTKKTGSMIYSLSIYEDN